MSEPRPVDLAREWKRLWSVGQNKVAKRREVLDAKPRKRRAWLDIFQLDIIRRSIPVETNGGPGCGHSAVLRSRGHRPAGNKPPKTVKGGSGQRVSHSASTPRSWNRKASREQAFAQHWQWFMAQVGADRWPARSCWPAPKHAQECARRRHGG